MTNRERQRQRDILTHLVRQAPIYLPAGTGQARAKALESFQRTSWIHCFALTRGADTRFIVAKCSHVYPHNHEGWTELHHFRQFNAVASPGRFECPRPIDVIEHLDVLLTERVKGTDLWTWLIQGNGGSRRIEAANSIGDNCGKWLRALHDFAPQQETPLSRDEFDTIAERILLALTPNTGFSLVSAVQRRELIEMLAAIRDRIDSIRLDYRPQHGDFAGRNILVDECGVIVLDMTCNTMAPTVADVANFGLALRLLCSRYRRLASLASVLRDAFAAAYQGPGVGAYLDPLALALYELSALARYGERHRRRLAALPRLATPVLRWHLRHTYARVTDHWLSAIEGVLRKPPESTT